MIFRAAFTSLLALSLGTATVGVANAAPSVVGMTYAKAKEALANAGIEPTIASSSGSTVPQDDCIVVSQVHHGEVVTGRITLPSSLWLSLNCYGSLATATTPGNSAASPEGREAKKQQEALEWRQTADGQAWCVKAKSQHPDWFPIQGCPD